MLRTFLVDLNNVDNLPFEQKLRFSPPNKHLLTEHFWLVLLQVPKYFGMVHIFCVGPKIYLGTYCVSHKHFVPDKKMICIQ